MSFARRAGVVIFVLSSVISVAHSQYDVTWIDQAVHHGVKSSPTFKQQVLVRDAEFATTLKP